MTPTIPNPVTQDSYKEIAGDASPSNTRDRRIQTGIKGPNEMDTDTQSAPNPERKKRREPTDRNRGHSNQSVRQGPNVVVNPGRTRSRQECDNQAHSRSGRQKLEAKNKRMRHRSHINRV